MKIIKSKRLGINPGDTVRERKASARIESVFGFLQRHGWENFYGNLPFMPEKNPVKEGIYATLGEREGGYNILITDPENTGCYFPEPTTQREAEEVFSNLTLENERASRLYPLFSGNETQNNGTFHSMSDLSPASGRHQGHTLDKISV